MAPKKVLFIVSEFYQAGTERFTYELHRALNKSKFEITILSIFPLQASKRFTDYYYEKHKELGADIYFLDEIHKRYQPNFKERFLRKIGGIPFPSEHIFLHRFLDQFEVISVMGEYNYPYMEQWMLPEHQRKCLIHIQNSKHQKKDLYVQFNHQKTHHFVSGFSEEEISWELGEFHHYQHTYYNLNFKIENPYVKNDFGAQRPKKIGIFTRLTPTKPLDPFLYAFQLVKDQLKEVELHIFGSGDPESEGVNRYIEQLELSEFVFFRGHQENIMKTAVQENLDLVWLHGYHGVPGGWAGFDICSTKIPQIFWDFGGTNQTQYYEEFPMYRNIKVFSETAVELLKNVDKAKFLGQRQYNFIFEYRNIDKFIHVMEELYLSKSQESQN